MYFFLLLSQKIGMKFMSMHVELHKYIGTVAQLLRKEQCCAPVYFNFYTCHTASEFHKRMVCCFMSECSWYLEALRLQGPRL
jgi:pentose-5-phosphate-3-epimerase